MERRGSGQNMGFGEKSAQPYGTRAIFPWKMRRLAGPALEQASGLGRFLPKAPLLVPRPSPVRLPPGKTGNGVFKKKRRGGLVVYELER